MCRATTEGKLHTPFADQCSNNGQYTAPTKMAGTGFFMPRTVSAPASEQELPCRNEHRRYRSIGRSFSSRRIEQIRAHCAQDQLQSPRVPSAAVAPALFSSFWQSGATDSSAEHQQLARLSTRNDDGFSNTDSIQDSSSTTTTTKPVAAVACDEASGGVLRRLSGAEGSILADRHTVLPPCLVFWTKPAVASACRLSDASTTAAGVASTADASSSCSMPFTSCNSLYGESFSCPAGSPWSAIGGIHDGTLWPEVHAAAAGSTHINWQAASLVQKQPDLAAAAVADDGAALSVIALDPIAPSCFVQPQLYPAPSSNAQLVHTQFLPVSTAAVRTASGQIGLPGPPINNLNLECSLLLEEASDLATIGTAIENELFQLLQLRQELATVACARAGAAGPTRSAVCTGSMPNPSAGTARMPTAVATPALPSRLAYAAQAALQTAGCDNREAVAVAVTADTMKPAAMNSAQCNMLEVRNAAAAVDRCSLLALNSSSSVPLSMAQQHWQQHPLMQHGGVRANTQLGLSGCGLP